MHDLEQLQPEMQQQHNHHHHQQQQTSVDAQQSAKLPQQLQQQQQQQAEPAAIAVGRPLTPQVVLRQWHDLLPEREFRCFIHQRLLTAISQRDITQHFPQLTMTGQLGNLKHQIKLFHQQHIADSFPVGSCEFTAASVRQQNIIGVLPVMPLHDVSACSAILSTAADVAVEANLPGHCNRQLVLLLHPPTRLSVTHWQHLCDRSTLWPITYTVSL